MAIPFFPCMRVLLGVSRHVGVPFPAGKGSFEWGANMARIWVHKPTVLAGKGFFHRLRLVAIFLNLCKNKIRVPVKRNGPFLTC